MARAQDHPARTFIIDYFRISSCLRFSAAPRLRHIIRSPKRAACRSRHQSWRTRCITEHHLPRAPDAGATAAGVPRQHRLRAHLLGGGEDHGDLWAKPMPMALLGASMRWVVQGNIAVLPDQHSAANLSSTTDLCEHNHTARSTSGAMMDSHLNHARRNQVNPLGTTSRRMAPTALRPHVEELRRGLAVRLRSGRSRALPILDGWCTSSHD